MHLNELYMHKTYLGMIHGKHILSNLYADKFQTIDTPNFRREGQGLWNFVEAFFQSLAKKDLILSRQVENNYFLSV